MTITVDVPNLRELTLDQLTEVWCASGGELEAEIEAELARREQAERRRAAARDAARRRNAEWEAAAYAQYLEADARARGNLLSEAGKRAKRDPWPMLWQGSEEDARKLASDELITFWDYESPRVPGPGQYRAAQRAAAAEQAARASDAPATPSAADLAEQAAASAAAAPPAPARPPGSIARYITKLNELTAALNRTHAAMARVNGGIQR